MKQIISLFYIGGNSDKVYHLQIVPSGDKFLVNAQWGRRGSTLQTGTKTTSPVSLEEATKIFDKVVSEKKAKGYLESETTKNEYSQTSTATVEPKQIILLPQLLNFIDNPQDYIDNDQWLMQRKYDGERRVIISDTDIIGVNKKGTSVPLPDCIKNSTISYTTLDGEAVGDIEFAFDLLAINGKSIKDLPCIERIKMLIFLKSSFGNAVKVAETAFTKEEKQAMFEEAKANNWEGVVYKLKSAKYVSGRPASGGDFLKHKFYSTATFIVSNHTSGKRSVGLELIGNNGERVPMGKVTISPDFEVPSISSIVEVRYLYAYKGGSLAQPVFLGKRKDSDLTDCTMKQIVYKAEE